MIPLLFLFFTWSVIFHSIHLFSYMWFPPHPIWFIYFHVILSSIANIWFNLYMTCFTIQLFSCGFIYSSFFLLIMYLFSHGFYTLFFTCDYTTIYLISHDFDTWFIHFHTLIFYMQGMWFHFSVSTWFIISTWISVDFTCAGHNRLKCTFTSGFYTF